MDLVIARCAGLDVHQATVVATVRVPAADGGRQMVTERFGTMTPDLMADFRLMTNRRQQLRRIRRPIRSADFHREGHARAL